jgi:two-component system, OmpR family, phosphate regulon sensor histidine kinase PhoR
MTLLNTFTLLSNGLTLAVSLGFLLIVLWHDARKELNQFFAAFLFLVTLWNVGSLLTLAVSFVGSLSPAITFTVSVMELGFTGSSIGVYALTAILVGVHTKRFRILAFTALFLVLGYQVFLILANITPPFEALGDGFFQYRFQPPATIFFLIFDGTTLYLVWRYRRKIRSLSLILGLTFFVIGQSLGFLNPELRIVSLSINLSSIATLVVSFAILRQEIIVPLAERIAQVQAVHRVSLAITSHIAIDTVLNQIATQAAGWLRADAAGIFLNENRQLELATVYNLPVNYIHSHVPLGDGVSGTVAKTQQSIFLENYDRDWKGIADLPLARETFGSVICVPLIYSAQTIGVLMVIAGRQGRLFQFEDVQLLELLGAQAAVALAHSRLFAEQHELTEQVEAARSQLETVLSGTENPVIAIDRNFRLIFANPAARKLLPQNNLLSKGNNILKHLPTDVLPHNHVEVIRNLRANRAHIYEISLDSKIYLCHVARLGQQKTEGWVVVLNDITQLKELDRLKSEMIRMTSHDLKNPLQAAMANLDLLTDDLAGINGGEIQSSLTAIHKQLMRMNRIISGILDLERIKSGTLTTALSSPSEIVAVVIDEIQLLAQDKGIDLLTVVDPGLPLFAADSEQFERALINLVENAIKFTPSGGKVVVRSRKQGSQLIFEVEDSGIGIPEELQADVFERFWRGAEKGQRGAEHISGTGLGLSLVKTIVENHHGRIELKSHVGKGTLFSIYIPITNEMNTKLVS